MLQFKRKCNVVIESTGDDIIIEGLRITFNVIKSVVSKYNKTEIEIYNLSEATRNRIDDKNKKVYLNAGYDDPGYSSEPITKLFTRLVQGDITLFKHRFEPPDIITKLELYEGHKEMNKEISHVSKENTTFVQALKKVCEEAKTQFDFKGLTINNLKDKVMTTGYSFSGKLKDAMDDLSESMDADWSMDGDIAKFITRGQNIPDLLINIDDTSGMIGVPEKIDDVNTKTGRMRAKYKGNTAAAPGYIITSLLNTNIVPGALMHFKSKKLHIDHDCIVHDVTHRGDTHGPEWTSRAKVLIK